MTTGPSLGLLRRPVRQGDRTPAGEWRCVALRAAPAPSTLVRAHHPGAASLADALFRAEREPHCLHWFRPVRKAGVTTGPSLGLLWQPVRQGDRTLAGEWRFGGTAPSTLVRAGHVRAHHPGAASLADALFRAEREPHCLHWF